MSKNGHPYYRDDVDEHGGKVTIVYDRIPKEFYSLLLGEDGYTIKNLEAVTNSKIKVTSILSHVCMQPSPHPHLHLPSKGIEQDKRRGGNSNQRTTRKCKAGEKALDFYDQRRIQPTCTHPKNYHIRVLTTQHNALGGWADMVDEQQQQ